MLWIVIVGIASSLPYVRARITSLPVLAVLSILHGSFCMHPSSLLM
jgi:hypothetical protein